MTASRTIEMFFDVGSSYSYLAFTQLEAIEKRSGVAIHARPFLLGGVFKATGNDMPARIPARARYLVTDMTRCAAECGVKWSLPAIFPITTVTTQRALVAADRLRGQPMLRKLARGLFDAYWVEGRDVSDRSVIVDIASKLGLDGNAIVSAIDEQETKDLLRKSTEDAVARGAFGAPTWFVGEEMFFGNDRIEQLERHLSSTR
jgi:2-hydroxychromene-2-carboxylate isomerase